MKLDKRKHWLPLSSMLVLMLIFSVVSAFSASPKYHPANVSTFIGPFPNKSALNHAILQTLEKQITKYPAAHVYWVRRRNGKGQAQPLLFYRRQPVNGLKAPCGIIWVSSDLHKITSQDYRWVFWATDKDIHTLAKKSASIQNLLDLHDQKP